MSLQHQDPAEVIENAMSIAACNDSMYQVEAIAVLIGKAKKKRSLFADARSVVIIFAVSNNDSVCWCDVQVVMACVCTEALMEGILSSVLTPILPSYAKEHGASDLEITVMFALFPLAVLLCSTVRGRVLAHALTCSVVFVCAADGLHRRKSWPSSVCCMRHRHHGHHFHPVWHDITAAVVVHHALSRGRGLCSNLERNLRAVTRCVSLSLDDCYRLYRDRNGPRRHGGTRNWCNFGFTNGLFFPLCVYWLSALHYCYYSALHSL